MKVDLKSTCLQISKLVLHRLSKMKLLTLHFILLPFLKGSKLAHLVIRQSFSFFYFSSPSILVFRARFPVNVPSYPFQALGQSKAVCSRYLLNVQNNDLQYQKHPRCSHSTQINLALCVSPLNCVPLHRSGFTPRKCDPNIHPLNNNSFYWEPLAFILWLSFSVIDG